MGWIKIRRVDLQSFYYKKIHLFAENTTKFTEETITELQIVYNMVIGNFP